MSDQEGDLKGKLAIVTGGGQGIGRAIAFTLAEAGADVSVLDTNLTSAQRVQQEIEEKFGVWAKGEAVDCTVYQEVHTAVGTLAEDRGHVDILVNNAAVQGIEHRAPFWKADPSDWDAVVKTNLMLTTYCCGAVLPFMQENGSGAIVNIASDAGRAGEAAEPVYSAAKAGVIGLTKALAKAVGKHQIRINAVSPSATHTPYSDELITEDLERKMLRAYPLGRLGTPDDIAAAVRYLVSPASSWVTGQVLSVNGGYYM